MAPQKVVFGDVPVERLLQALDIDPVAGTARWKERARGRRIGREAGWLCKGYRHLVLDYRAIAVHRLIWAVAHGRWPKQLIDQRDGNPLNNRIDNLRLTTPVQNSTNKKVQSNNTSGFPGVSLHKQCKRWRARLNSAGVTHDFGLSNSKESAIAACRAAILRVHGEFAREI